MRRRTTLTVAAIVAALTVAAAPAAQASAAAPRRPVPERPQAHVQQFAPLITAALRRLAFRRASIVIGQRFERWGARKVAKVARKVVFSWVRHKARECPDPLPDWFFCRRPPEPEWGRGIALEIGGYRPGEFRSPWSPRNPPRTLFPGYVFWLTCWTPGATVDNGLLRSNFWYRLTNGLFVSDAWLDTGTNSPLPDVARC
jgi:hypothetical protein